MLMNKTEIELPKIENLHIDKYDFDFTKNLNNSELER